MTKIENIGIPSIDSFKLRLEVGHLDSFDKSLLDTLVTYNAETSEVEKEFKRGAKNYPCKEYSYYASYVENVRVSKERYVDCIMLLINSKQLGSDYFKGITIETIKGVYDDIKSLGIVKCGYSTFLNSAITDIDVKKDHYLELDEYKELCKTLAIMTKPSSNRDKGCTTFKDKTNYGIAWSKRETTKYLSQPYLKIYHKGIELLHHSVKFYDEYLKFKEVKNVMRIETTIKNKKHLTALNLDFNKYSLDEFLRLSNEQLNEIIGKAVNSHLAPRSKVRTFKSKRDLSPSHQTILNSISICTTELNWSLLRIENHLLKGIENKVSKSRQKKLIKELYEDEIKGTNYDSKSTKIDSVLDSFGWF